MGGAEQSRGPDVAALQRTAAAQTRPVSLDARRAAGCQTILYRGIDRGSVASIAIAIFGLPIGQESPSGVIIRNLEEFGPGYFVIAQVTGISAKRILAYPRLRPHHALIQAGEEIPIQVENVQRLVTAIEALRRAATESPAPPAAAPAEAACCFAKAKRALRTASAELDKLRLMPLDVGGRMRLQSAIGETTGKLELLAMQVTV